MQVALTPRNSNNLFLAIDIVFRQMPATKQFIVGGVLIIVSFVLCTIPIREIGAFAKRKQEAHDDEQQ